MKGRRLLLACVLLLAQALCLSDRVLGADIGGFVEAAYGLKLGDERAEKNAYNLSELRVQLKGLYLPEALDAVSGEVAWKGEALIDGYEGDTSFYFRELNLSFTPFEFMDLKVGRQILTWGTGDLLFVNDLFPKDYVSFFTGRDDEYLKLPSDALRLWVFTEYADLDLVIIPSFTPNESVRGKRLSFYDGLKGRIIGREDGRTFVEPKNTAENMELALRVRRTLRSSELELYFFRGFYKEPRGILDSDREEYFYPRLNVYGASLRGPLLGGIGSIEVGFYDSREDTKGRNGNIENSSVKYLAGYTRELTGDFSVGVQYLVEEMLLYDRYRDSLSAGTPAKDEFRHLVTLRLTRLFLSQTLKMELFTFYSPSDRDVYLRPSISYDVTDALGVTAGANIFSGSFDHTEFGQLEGNDNLYLRARYSF